MAKRNQQKKYCGVPALLLTAALVFLLSACAKTESASAESTEAKESKLANFYNFSGTDAESYEKLQTEIGEAEASFAVAKIGDGAELAGFLSGETADTRKAQEALEALIKRSRLAENYPFILQMPVDRIVRVGEGNSLYLAVPGSAAEGVEICKIREAGDLNAPGDTVTRYNGAYPVLLLGDSFYLKESSGHGGSAAVAEDGSSSDGVLNISFKEEEITAENLKGKWAARGIKNDIGAGYDLYLEFDPDGSFRYYYMGADNDQWQDKTIMHFSGSWELGADNTVSLEVTADGGAYVEAGVPMYDSGSEHRLSLADGTGDSLYVTYRSGDRFFTGLVQDEIRFERTE